MSIIYQGHGHKTYVGSSLISYQYINKPIPCSNVILRVSIWHEWNGNSDILELWHWWKSITSISASKHTLFSPMLHVSHGHKGKPIISAKNQLIIDENCFWQMGILTSYPQPPKSPPPKSPQGSPHLAKTQWGTTAKLNYSQRGLTLSVQK